MKDRLIYINQYKLQEDIQTSKDLLEDRLIQEGKIKPVKSLVIKNN